MSLKLICKIWIVSLFLFLAPTYAQFDQSIKHIIEIHTQLYAIVGKPTWLIVLRDVDSGRILTFMYDFIIYDNNWIAYSKNRKYRIVSSSLKFGPDQVINNFCGIQDGILEGKSMYITLTGAITPDPATAKCHVLKYNDVGFTVVKPTS